MVKIQGDRALSADGVDRLGFHPTAERLAEALAVGTSTDGFVVGVTGRWGSGKSSLLNLAHAALLRRDLAKRPHLVEFKPWLVGDRDALLAALFGELVSGIDKIELDAGDATGTTIRQFERATNVLREFADLLTGTGKVIKAANFIRPGLGLVGTVTERLGEAFKKREISLAKSKKKVCNRLRKLNRSLVVVIDDVDRLEPVEIVEVLRLVRSVADFPNIIYVLSYDQEIVAHAVKVAARVRDGHAYIEKIVQITLPVPIPEAFDLRRWFERELANIDLSLTDDDQRRIFEIIDRDGGRYLTSPRAVVRTLDSIRFYWAVLKGQVDVSDFVWLQFIKVGNPSLHAWIEIYLTEISARASGRVHISDENVGRSRIDLDRAIAREGKTFSEICGRLADHLPGIAPYHQEATGGIYEKVDRRTMDSAIEARRLASPDHYRLYFAFAQPTNAPRMSDFAGLRDAVSESADRALELLREWHHQRLTSGVSRAEIMLDRFAAEGLINLAADQAENLLVALANVMDELGAQTVNDFGGSDVWRRAMRSLPPLLAACVDRREDVLRRMFRDGAALGWLTSIFRHETFAHGRFGDRPESDQLLSEIELDIVADEMLARYQAMSLAQFGDQLQPLSTLFAWQQGGDEEGPRRLLADEIETDEGLVSVLEILTGRVRTGTSTGTREYVTLSRSNIQSLVNYDEVRARIEHLAEHAADETLRGRAQRLRQNFQNGDHF